MAKAVLSPIPSALAKPCQRRRISSDQAHAQHTLGRLRLSPGTVHALQSRKKLMFVAYLNTMGKGL